MAERERRRTDPYALARGAVRGAVTAAFVAAIGYGAGAAFGPVLRDLGYGGLGTWQYLWMVAAGVGVLAGVGSVRANRRYVGGTSAGESDGPYADSSALRIARSNLGADRGSRGLQDRNAVRHWSSDLLSSGASRPDSESLT